MKLYLFILEGKLKGKKFPVEEGAMIGRSRGEIPLDDPKVSGRHARIDLKKDGHFYITDLGSTNGIKIDGKKVKELKLLPGISFQAGRTFVQVQDEYGHIPKNLDEIASQQQAAEAKEDLIDMVSEEITHSKLALPSIPDVKEHKPAPISPISVESEPKSEPFEPYMEPTLASSYPVPDAQPSKVKSEFSLVLDTGKLKLSAEDKDRVFDEKPHKNKEITFTHEKDHFDDDALDLPKSDDEPLLPSLPSTSESAVKPGSEESLELEGSIYSLEDSQKKEGDLSRGTLALETLSTVQSLDKPEQKVEEKPIPSKKEIKPPPSKEASEIKDPIQLINEYDGTKLSWQQHLGHISDALAAHGTEQTKVTVPLTPALSLEFFRGIQTDTKWILGYGPRRVGPISLDLIIEEPGAPDICFEILPSPQGLTYKTNYPDKVLLNGKSLSSELLNNGDVISINETHIAVGFINDPY